MRPARRPLIPAVVLAAALSGCIEPAVTPPEPTTAPPVTVVAGPLPPGIAAAVGDWEVAVLAATPDATDAVLARNRYNDPPAPGRVYTMVRIAATYRGVGVQSPFSGLTFLAVGPSAGTYDHSHRCGVIPDPFPDGTGVYSGGTVVGNLCWEVDAADAGNLVLVAEEAFALDGGRILLTVPPAGVEYPAPEPPPALLGGGGSAGSRGNPVPAGDTVTVAGWQVTVLGSTPDATGAVLDENQFNDPPGPGRVFTMVRVAITNLGTDPVAPFGEISFNSVGPGAVTYGPDSSCGVIPGRLDVFDEIPGGATAVGHLCWEVDAGEVAGLVLIVRPAFGSAVERIHLAIP